MNLLRKISYRILPCLVVLFCHLLPVFPEAGDSHPVLLISSYNPDARQTSGNISDFMEEFQRLKEYDCLGEYELQKFLGISAVDAEDERSAGKIPGQ
jgi:hypothetical protein